MEDIRKFLQDAASCVDQLQSRFALSDVNGLEYGLRKLEQFIDVFAAIHSALASNAMQEIHGQTDVMTPE